MADAVPRRPLDVALRSMLNSVMSAAGGTIPRFEIGRAPAEVRRSAKDDRLRDGYGIIYPLTSPVWGSLGSPEDVLTGVYQLTLVGRSDEHAQSLSDQACFVLTGRGANGLFTNPINPVGLTVIERRTAERGSLTPASDGLWQVADVYELETQNAA